MLSIGIIWNSANNHSDAIINDMSGEVKILGSIKLDLGDEYFNFVRDIYASENMETWKIDKKISHMLSSNNRDITIVYFEFDDNEIEFHKFKNKNVFTKLEECKRKIREKYKEYVVDYTFDIVFHATDNLQELKNCHNVVISYLDNLNRKRVLKLINQKM